MHSQNKTFITLILILFILILFSGISLSSIVTGKHDLSVLTCGAGFCSSNEDEICIFCHTPHNALVVDSQGNRLPLWNRSIARNDIGGAGGPFTVYASTTLNATVGQPSGVSLLCMSCHDGVTAINSLINFGKNNPIVMAGFDQLGDVYNTTFPNFPGANIGGAIDPATGGYPQSYAPYGGAGTVNVNTKRLDDDHPVSFVFNSALATADGGLVTPVSTSYVDSASKLRLFGGKLECATCHNAHEDGTFAAGDYPFLRMSNNGSAMCITCHLK